MDREEMTEIALKENKKRLSISRVPTKTKELFVALANEEFAEDFGLCLKWCLDQAVEYQTMKESFFNSVNYKLDNILEIISQNEQNEEKSENSIAMMSGRKVEGGKQNEWFRTD